MSAINYIMLAKAAKAAASECIASCRRQAASGHFTHRGVEVLAIDDQDERIEPPLDYINVKELTGKRLQQIVTTRAPAQWHSICVQGGCDGYSSFQEAMQYPDDYDPGCEWWDVDSTDLEAAQVESAERVKEGDYKHKPTFLTGSNNKGLNTRADDPIVTPIFGLRLPG